MLRVKWTAVVAEIRSRIADGTYTPDQQLPTMRELAVAFDTTRATVEKAVRYLEARGILTVRDRSGIYVRRVAFYERRLVGDVFSEHDLVLAGEVDPGGLFERMTGATEDVQVTSEYARVPAPLRVAALLDLPPGTTVLERTWTYTTDGEPYQLARSYLPLAIAQAAGLAGPESERKGVGTLWQLIRDGGVALRYVYRALEARVPDPEEEKALALPPGTAVMDRWGALRLDDGTPVEAGVMTSARVRFTTDMDLWERTVR